MKKVIYLLSLLFVTVLVACKSDGESEDGADAEKVGASVDNSAIAGKILSLDNPLMSFTINIHNLIEKSNIKNLSISDEVDMGMMMAEGYVGSDNKLGIDWNQNIVVTVCAENFEKMDRPEVYGFLSINDAEKLKSVLENEAGAEVNEIGGMHIANMDGTTTIAFTDKLLGVYFSSDPGKDGEALLVAAMENETSTEVEEFTAFLGKEKDLSMFYFVGNGMNGLEIPDSVSNKLDELIDMEKFYAEVEMNFEKGKFVTTSKNHNLTDELKSYLKLDGGIEPALAQSTTTNGEAAIQAMYAFNLKKFVNTMMGYIPPKQLAEAKMNLSAMGLTIDDLKNTFTGQFAMSMTNLPKQSSKSFNSETGEFESRNDGNYGKFAVAAKVSDKKALETLFTTLPEMRKKEGYYEMIDEEDTMYYLIQDENFIATSNKAVIDYNMNGTSTELKDAEYKGMINADNMFAFKLDGSLFANMPIAKDDKAAQMFLTKLTKVVGHGTFEEAEFILEVDNQEMNILEYIVRSVVEAQKEGYIN